MIFRLPLTAISPRLQSLRVASISPLPSILRASSTRRSPFSPAAQVRLASTMQPSELQQYLADQPPTIVPLKIEQHFELLTDEQKRYSHFISRHVYIH